MSGTRAPDEFELIARYLAPLAATQAGALGLLDDAAVLSISPGHELVATTDALVAGVHFFPDDPPDLIARKLLRVNLSDLAAMGAVPKTYLLVLALPDDISAEWLETFAAGLAADQESFGVSLIGGDTVAMRGPVTLTLTALGEVPSGQALRRTGGRAGDRVYVSGTVGDGVLGLRVLTGALDARDDDRRQALIDRYRLPQPRIALGQRLVGLARAAIDVSDGLVADLGHVCATSGVGAVIEAGRLPLSAAAQTLLRSEPELLVAVLAGGDDYELIFTAAPGEAARVETLAAELGLPLTEIGRLVPGAGVRVLDAEGAEISLSEAGYRHFRPRS